MVFGNAADFAIEAYHEPSGPRWAGFGRIAIDIEGVRLGDVRENHCSLFHAVERLRETVSAGHALWHDSFADLPDAEIFDRINDALYVGEPGSTGGDYHRFDFLTNTGEQFDCCKTFIVCRPEGRFHILYELNDGNRGSGSCSPNRFRQIACSFVDWFEAEVKLAGGPWLPVDLEL